MDSAFIERYRERSAYERARTGPPEGFPSLPDLPLGRYTSNEFYALEHEHLWPNVWLFVGHESQWPETGSYRTIDKPGLPPLVVTRADDGVIRAFANACRHRGAPVVRDESGMARLLVCQYHSWSYDLTGALVRVPDERDFVALCMDERGLVPVRCETWAGLVFVTRSATIAPLIEWLGPVPGILGELDGLALRVVDHKTDVLRCNWKILAEGFLEVYHVRTIHATTVAAALDPAGAVMGLYPNGHQSMLTPLRSEVGEHGNRPSHRGLPVLPGMTELFFTTNPAFGIFPNLITPLDPYGFPLLVFWPIDIATTALDIIWLGAPWDGDRPEAWERRLAGFDVVMAEDYRNLEPVQRAVAAAAHGGIPLNYQERRIWHVHTTIDATIGRHRIPDQLAVPDLLAEWVES